MGGIWGLGHLTCTSPKSSHEKTGGGLLGMNAWQKRGIGPTNVPGGMTPAISVTPPFIVRLLLGGLTSLSLVTTVFSYPSTAQRAAESWGG